jgi:hypothetical protein
MAASTVAPWWDAHYALHNEPVTKELIERFMRPAAAVPGLPHDFPHEFVFALPHVINVSADNPAASDFLGCAQTACRHDGVSGADLGKIFLRADGEFDEVAAPPRDAAQIAALYQQENKAALLAAGMREVPSPTWQLFAGGVAVARAGLMHALPSDPLHVWYLGILRYILCSVAPLVCAAFEAARRSVVANTLSARVAVMAPFSTGYTSFRRFASGYLSLKRMVRRSTRTRRVGAPRGGSRVRAPAVPTRSHNAARSHGVCAMPHTTTAALRADRRPCAVWP